MVKSTVFLTNTIVEEQHLCISFLNRKPKNHTLFLSPKQYTIHAFKWHFRITNIIFILLNTANFKNVSDTPSNILAKKRIFCSMINKKYSNRLHLRPSFDRKTPNTTKTAISFLLPRVRLIWLNSLAFLTLSSTSTLPKWFFYFFFFLL